jgi:hypothetical protein
MMWLFPDLDRSAIEPERDARYVLARVLEHAGACGTSRGASGTTACHASTASFATRGTHR